MYLDNVRGSVLYSWMSDVQSSDVVFSLFATGETTASIRLTWEPSKNSWAWENDEW